MSLKCDANLGMSMSFSPSASSSSRSLFEIQERCASADSSGSIPSHSASYYKQEWTSSWSQDSCHSTPPDEACLVRWLQRSALNSGERPTYERLALSNVICCGNPQKACNCSERCDVTDYQFALISYETCVRRAGIESSGVIPMSQALLKFCFGWDVSVRHVEAALEGKLKLEFGSRELKCTRCRSV